MESSDLRNQKISRLLRISSLTAGLVSVGLGLLVIIGWHLGNQTLVQILPTFVPMQYNTALGFVFCGLSLLLLVTGYDRWTSWTGSLAGLIGVLTLIEYLGGINLGIDELFMQHDITVETFQPGRMAPNTALCFTLIGFLTLTGRVRLSSRYKSFGQVLLASLTFGLGTVALSGYLTQLETAYGWGNLTRMAVHTSLGLIIVSLGFLFLTWLRDLQDDTSLPRWMPIPVAIAILTTTLSLWQAIYTEGTRISRQYQELSSLPNLALLVLVIGILLALAMAASVFLAQKSGRRAREASAANLAMLTEIRVRQRAERALKEHRNNLEKTVDERTHELNRARLEAEAANRAKSDFLSHMSHELRTPLNGILGYAQILQRDIDPTSKHQPSLQAIRSSGDHLLTLINDVLDLSKIEAGKIEIDKNPIDLSRLIDRVAGMISAKTKQKGLEFLVERSLKLPRVILSDAAKLRQILINLLGNAVKFTNQGSISLLVSEASGTLRFEVHDTGVGIAEKEIEEIFDPFKQVEAGKAAGGTGLGLAITQKLVSALEGTLDVRSEIGKGSVFTVAIPLVEACEEELTPGFLDETSNGLYEALEENQNWTILVADDRKINRDVLQGMLDGAGFKTLPAADGVEALDVLRENAVDLVLMDVRMPRLNGIDALKRIRKDPDLRHLKVISVTASVFPEFKAQAIAAGFDDFLGKPFRIGELFKKLKIHLGAKFVSVEPLISQSQPELTSLERDDETLIGGVGKIPSEIVERLNSALRIKNLTAINLIAEELLSNQETAGFGERIRYSVQNFDFQQLANLVKELE